MAFLAAFLILAFVIFMPSNKERNQELNVQDSGSDIQAEPAQQIPEETFEEKYWRELVDDALENKECPKPPLRNFSSLDYKGPMIDAHIHIMSLPDGGPGSEADGDNLGDEFSIGDWVCMMDYEGTSKALAFFPVWDPIIRQSIDVVNKTMEKYPGRFIPFIMPPDSDNSPEGSSTVDATTLKGMLSVYPDLFRGYGEIGLYGRSGGASPLPPNSKRLLEIYPVVRESGLVVYFHLGEGQKEAFEEVLADNPDITFIWHGDQLIQCAGCKQTLKDVEEILENHPNVYYGIDELYGDVFLMRPGVSKEEFIAHFGDYEPLLEKDLGTWKQFIENHPDQVLWDTDRGVGVNWSLDQEVALTLNDYSRAFIGRLNPSVQEKFAYKNVEKIFS